MKRDMDLGREILLEMEKSPEPIFGGEIEIDGVSEGALHLQSLDMTRLATYLISQR